MGIEPTYLAWKASVLPLNYTRTFFGREFRRNSLRNWCVSTSSVCPEPESNQRHEDFQSSALPTELSGPIAFATKVILHYEKGCVKNFCTSLLTFILDMEEYLLYSNGGFLQRSKPGRNSRVHYVVRLHQRFRR